MEHKAQIQVQFHWIFVVVAGAVILAFFAGFAVKYKNLQEEKSDVELLSSLDKTFTELQSSYFPTRVELDIPSKFSVGCAGENVKISVGRKDYDTNNLIFSSGEMKGKILVWYMPYKMPYKIANFYYVASKDVKIYLVSEHGTEELAELLKKEIGKYFENVIVSNSFVSDSHKNERVIYLANSYKNVGHPVIVPGSDWHEGFVFINGERYRYLGLPMLYGVIFSDDYGCLTGKVNEIRKEVADNYIRKLKIIQKSGCNYEKLAVDLADFSNEPNYEKSLGLEKVNKEIGDRCVPAF